MPLELPDLASVVKKQATQGTLNFRDTIIFQYKSVPCPIFHLETLIPWYIWVLQDESKNSNKGEIAVLGGRGCQNC